jgi:hypothetical protein
MENQSTVDEFFDKLPSEDKESADIFDEKKPEAIKPKADDIDPEEVPESIKDRRHRRLEQKLQAERESNIALSTRLNTLSEMDKFAKDNAGEVNPDIAKMFDNSEVGKENALRMSKVLRESEERAEQRAIERLEAKQAAAAEEQKKYENQIDTELETLEDQYNVDLTSDSPKARKARRELLEAVQEISPKDENGDIIAYADFDATFKQYQRSLKEEKPDNSRRQEIASRSMQRSSGTSGDTPKITRGFDGWKTDYKL